MRVSHYEPPHTFGFVSEDLDFGEISHVFTFHEEGGAVIILRTMTVSMNPFVAILFQLFIYPLISRPSMKKSMEVLKMKLDEKVRVAS